MSDARDDLPARDDLLARGPARFDPVRLMDGENVDPALRAALRQVSRAEPGAAEVAALVERVGDALSGSAGGASWLSQFVSHGGGLKLLALLVAGGATVWGAAKVSPMQARRELTTVATHAPAPVAQVEPLRTGARDQVAQKLPGAIDVRPAPPHAEAGPRGTAAVRGASRARGGGRSAQGSAASSALQGALASTPATGVQRSATARAASARSEDEAAPRAHDRASEGEESELALITRAQSALKVAPRRALELLERHDTLYPIGHFAEEREVLWIDALSQLGMTRALAARGQRFLANYPSSIHCARVRSLLAAARPAR